jgi:hypothetical protein
MTFAVHLGRIDKRFLLRYIDVCYKINFSFGNLDFALHR